MKKEHKKTWKKWGMFFSICLMLLGTFCVKNIIDTNPKKLFAGNQNDFAYMPNKSTVVLEYLQKEVENKIVYDNLTMDQLIEKLNRSLKGKLAGTGEQIATKSLELGIDPYLAVAIMLHETGCNGTCSKLVETCNNVGGMKGSPGCNGGSYIQYDTIQQGIDSFMNNLYRNYIAKGLTTPEQINVRYAASKTWASKVIYYIDKIKAS